MEEKEIEAGLFPQGEGMISIENLIANHVQSSFRLVLGDIVIIHNTCKSMSVGECQTLYSLLFLGLLLPELAYGDFEAVTATMIEPLVHLTIEPDNLILVKAHSHASVSSLEDRRAFVLSSLLCHEDVTGLQNYK